MASCWVYMFLTVSSSAELNATEKPTEVVTVARVGGGGLVVGALVVGAAVGPNPLAGPSPINPRPQKSLKDGHVSEPDMPIEVGGETVPPFCGQVRNCEVQPATPGGHDTKMLKLNAEALHTYGP